MPVRLSVCMPVRLSVCMPVRLSVCMSMRAVCVHACASVCVHVCAPVCNHVCATVCVHRLSLSVRLSVCLTDFRRSLSTDRSGDETWHIGHGAIPYTASFILEAVVAKWQGTAGHSTEVRSARMDHLAVTYVMVSCEHISAVLFIRQLNDSMCSQFFFYPAVRQILEEPWSICHATSPR